MAQSYLINLVITYINFIKINGNHIKNLHVTEIINLASTEYFKAIDHKKLQLEIITPIFKDYKNGNYKVIMMYAKNARGAMANFIIKNQS